MASFPWLTNPWMTWGVAPFLAANLGYYPVALSLEWVIRQPWAQPHRVTYTKGADRVALTKATAAKVGGGFAMQLRAGAWHMTGPTAVLNAALNAFIMPLMYKGTEDWTALPSWGAMLGTFLLLELLGDLALYFGHRIQHENEWLWKNCHSLHHTLDTPTPVGTVYIDATDATLQGGLPILFAAALVRPADAPPRRHTVAALLQKSRSKV